MNVVAKHLRRTTFASMVVLAATAGASGTALAANGKITIANVSLLVGDPYFISMKCGAQAAAKALDIELLWNGSTSPDVAPEKQIFDAFKLRNPDGWVLTTFSQTAFIESVKEQMAQGKPVVLADSTLEQNVFYQGYHSDNDKGGDEIAAYLAANFKTQGKIGIVAAVPGNPIDEARYQSLPEKLKAIAPHLTVLDAQYAKADSNTASKIAAGLIIANPDLVAIYATNGPQAQGVIAAVRSAKAEDRIKVIAYDAAPDEVEALKAGRVEALLAQSPYKIGEAAVKAAVDYVKAHPAGGAVQPLAEPYATAPTMLLTKANMDSEAAKPFFYVSSCE